MNVCMVAHTKRIVSGVSANVTQALLKTGEVAANQKNQQVTRDQAWTSPTCPVMTVLDARLWTSTWCASAGTVAAEGTWSGIARQWSVR